MKTSVVFLLNIILVLIYPVLEKTDKIQRNLRLWKCSSCFVA